MATETETKHSRGIPAGPGPYGVGCVDVMAGLSTSGVFFRLFYPTVKTAQGPPLKQRPKWLPSNQYAKGYGAVAGKKLAGVTLKWFLSKFTLPVLWHGQLSPAKDRYPVVIFSHGLGGCRTTYSSTCIDIASMGCVVAAVEHRDKSACCSFIINNNNSNSAGDEGKSNHMDQQWVNYHKAPYQDEDLRRKQVNQRKDECIAVLDYLQDLNEGAALENDMDQDFDLSQFQECLDFDEVAVCGHSFGGATTIACLSRDDRFKCGIGFDVWMYPLEKSYLTVVKQPMLFVNTDNFHWRENILHMKKVIPNTDATSGPRQMITIRGTVHQSQSDFGLLLPQFLAKLSKMRGELDPHVAMAINNQAAIHFLSNYLNIDIDQTDGPLTSLSEHVTVGTNVTLDKDGNGKKNQEPPGSEKKEQEQEKEGSQNGGRQEAKKDGETGERQKDEREENGRNDGGEEGRKENGEAEKSDADVEHNGVSIEGRDNGENQEQDENLDLNVSKY